MDFGMLDFNNNNYVNFRNDLRNTLFYLSAMLFIMIRLFLYSGSYLIGILILFISFITYICYDLYIYISRYIYQNSLDELEY